VELGCVREGSFCGVAVLHAKAVEDFASVSRLREVDWACGCGSVDVHAEEAFDGAEVTNSVEL